LRQFGAKAKEKGAEVLEKLRNSAKKKDDT
jgi:hypothetical protein